MSQNLTATLEAILFYKAEPLSKKRLAELLNTDEATVENALIELKSSLTNRGIALLEQNGAYMLGTAPEASAVVEKIIKDELSKDLGKAGLETLAIILYKGPVSRSEIDYIRGVNSSFIVRNLTIRGLVEKSTKEGDSRTFMYQPSFELLAHLGVRSVSDLPDYEATIRELETLLISEPSSA